MSLVDLKEVKNSLESEIKELQKKLQSELQKNSYEEASLTVYFMQERFSELFFCNKLIKEVKE